MVTKKPAKKAPAKAEKAVKETKAKATKTAKAPTQASKIRIKIYSFDHKVVDGATRQIVETVERTGAIIAGPIPLPTHKRKITVNRSTFVNKDAREQFEINTHKRMIDINESSPNTISALTNLSLPSGVDIEIKTIS